MEVEEGLCPDLSHWTEGGWNGMKEGRGEKVVASLCLYMCVCLAMERPEDCRC